MHYKYIGQQIKLVIVNRFSCYYLTIFTIPQVVIISTKLHYDKNVETVMVNKATNIENISWHIVGSVF
jgi:hypothetical protein